jgi:hypothetical protein
MKIASMKNEKPSIAKPTPNTLPNVPVKFGHSSPISKLKTVPVITPTPNSVAITFVQRRANVRYSRSPVRWPSHSTNSTITGKEIPKHTSGVWTATAPASGAPAADSAGRPAQTRQRKADRPLL